MDGDFLPISLLAHESNLRRLAQGDDSAVRPVRVAIYRMEFNLDTAAAVPAKRSSDGSVKPVNKAVVKKARTFEYVNIGALYESMFLAMKQASGTNISSRTSHDQYFMLILASLIGLCGTDFTRNIPCVGVKRLWDLIADRSMWGAIIRSFDIETCQLVESEACNRLVAGIYLNVYNKHTNGVPSNLRAILSALSNSSKLSERTKKLLPSYERVAVSVRNVNWVLYYWRALEPPLRDIPVDADPSNTAPADTWRFDLSFPDPMQPDVFGFSRSKNRKNAICYADDE